MKFGANTFIWADHFGKEQIPLLETVKRAGFDGIEIPLIEPEQTRDRDVRRAIEEHGLECTICSVLPPGLSAISADSPVRKKTLEHLRICVETTAEMGSRIIAGPLYAPRGIFFGPPKNGGRMEPRSGVLSAARTFAR